MLPITMERFVARACWLASYRSGGSSGGADARLYLGRQCEGYRWGCNSDASWGSCRGLRHHHDRERFTSEETRGPDRQHDLFDRVWRRDIDRDPRGMGRGDGRMIGTSITLLNDVILPYAVGPKDVARRGNAAL